MSFGFVGNGPSYAENWSIWHSSICCGSRGWLVNNVWSPRVTKNPTPHQSSSLSTEVLHMSNCSMWTVLLLKTATLFLPWKRGYSSTWHTSLVFSFSFSRKIKYYLLFLLPFFLFFFQVSLMMDYLTFKEDNDLVFFSFYFISSSRMTSNQLGASTILQTRPNSLGKMQIHSLELLLHYY